MSHSGPTHSRPAPRWRRIAWAAAWLASLASPALAIAPKLSVGASHMLMLKSDGSVTGWGGNLAGQLAGGTTGGRWLAPTPLPGLGSGVVDVVARGGWSMALKADGTVWVWGNVSDGRDGIDHGGGGQFAATPTQVPGLRGIVAIASSFNGMTGFAIDTSGQAWAWGGNGYGLLGTGSSTPLSRAAPQAVPGATGIVRIEAVETGVIALRQDGAVLGWGDNGNGTANFWLKSTPGTGIFGPTLLQVPAMKALAISPVNGGLAIGVTGGGQALQGGQTNSTLAPCAPIAPSTANSPYTVPGLASVADAAGGSGWALYRLASGQISACGYNADGQLGDGTLLSTTYFDKRGPVAVQGLPAAGVAGIAAGPYAAAAWAADGSVYTWGRGSEGLLGDGTDNASPTKTATARASLNLGATSNTLAVVSGSQSGAATSANVDVGIRIPEPHQGQAGALFLAALLPSGALFLYNGATQQFEPLGSAASLPTLAAGTLPRALPLAFATGLNLAPLAGVQVWLGYGLGATAAAAADDMLRNNRYGPALTLR